MAWLGTWAKRVKLTIDSGDIDANLSDFPILIYISASSGRNSDDISFVFDELTADANRKKIAVTKSDGTTELYVEIEQWDDGNEKAWLWVKVSGVDSIGAGSDTDLYLYYDSAHADNDTYVGDTNSAVSENVWDANFKLVYHMRDGADNEHVYDSTTNDNDGTKGAAGEPTLDSGGQVNEAQNYDGGDFITTADDTDFDFERTDPFSVSVWMKTVIDNAFKTILGHRDGSSPYRGWELYQGPSVDRQRHGFVLISDHTTVNEIDVYTNADTIDANTWQRYSITYDGSSDAVGVKLYINGALHADVDGADALTATIKIAADMTFGGRDGSGAFEGLLDEIRIAATERAAAWEKASYESEIDNLLDFGSEESLGNIPEKMKHYRMLRAA